MIIDLHADILSYLAKHPYNSAYDDACRTSISQLVEGGVTLQVMPTFTKTRPGQSNLHGLKQAKIYKELAERYEGDFGPQARIKTRLAIENASCLFAEDEPFEKGLRRLKNIAKTIERPLYMCLTWNGENRFGGGNLTKVGLKEDGKRLLSELAGNCMAIDFSHTSDKLAFDILKHLQKEKLPLAALASHSNFRAVHAHQRNLPDEIADCIVNFGGIIGLNFIRPFLGSTKESFFDHVEYGLKKGYQNALALGSDFFASSLLPGKAEYFFKGLDNASCFVYIQKELGARFGKKIARAICYDNAFRFLSTY
jgi:microsomal dipeptidase-like Zn-dependent dipeptidase